MAITDFTMIRRSLRARLFSTVTTVAMVAISVALLLVLLSMRDAGKQAFARGSGNMDLLISRDASPLVAVLNGVFYANSPRNPIEWSKYEEIAQSHPWAFALPVQHGDSYRGLPVTATVREFFFYFEPNRGDEWVIAAGDDYFEGPFEVVVGADAARRAQIGVGDQIYLTHGVAEDGHVHKDYAYTVVSVLAPTGSAHDRAIFANLEGAWVVHAQDRRVLEFGEGTTTTVGDLVEADMLITGIYAKVHTREGRAVTAALQGTFDTLRRDTTITVANPANQIKKLFSIVSNIDQVFLGMAVVVMVSSGIAIMLALYNSMEQRRRQIATLRVLGCSKGRIFSLVITESAVIGVLGAVAGIGVSAIGGLVVAAIMKDKMGIEIDAGIDGRWILVVVAGTVALASVAGIVPAVGAYRTSVARSLRPLG